MQTFGGTVDLYILKILTCCPQIEDLIRSKLALVLGLTFILAEMAFKRSKHFRNRNYKFYRLPWVQFFLLLVLLTFVSTNSGINYAVYGQR